MLKNIFHLKQFCIIILKLLSMISSTQKNCKKLFRTIFLGHPKKLLPILKKLSTIDLWCLCFLLYNNFIMVCYLSFLYGVIILDIKRYPLSPSRKSQIFGVFKKTMVSCMFVCNVDLFNTLPQRPTNRLVNILLQLIIAYIMMLHPFIIFKKRFWMFSFIDVCPIDGTLYGR